MVASGAPIGQILTYERNRRQRIVIAEAFAKAAQHRMEAEIVANRQFGKTAGGHGARHGKKRLLHEHPAAIISPREDRRASHDAPPCRWLSPH